MSCPLRVSSHRRARRRNLRWWTDRIAIHGGAHRHGLQPAVSHHRDRRRAPPRDVKARAAATGRMWVVQGRQGSRERRRHSVGCPGRWFWVPNAADLFRRADSAWWAGDLAEALAGYEMAYRAHLDEGDHPGAAMAALLLGEHALEAGESAVGSGWVRRARSLLDDMEEAAVHGYPLYWDVFAAMGRGEIDTALALADRMRELGRTHEDANLVALGLMCEGRCRLKRAEVDAGMTLLDESMVMVLSDDLHPLWVGAIYCHLMDACQELQDLQRAATWTEATSRWCDQIGRAVVYRGICRVHRAHLFQVQGAWDLAAAEARRASLDMPRVHVGTGAEAHYRLGDIHRLRGEVAEARAAYLRAHELGRSPQPGLALLWSIQGDHDAACTSLRTALAELGGERLDRAPVVAALVEVAIAAGELESARAAAAELRETAAAFDTPGLDAAARQAAGTLELAEDDPERALRSLRAACSAWLRVDAPYDTARCRHLLARAYRAVGDDSAAELEQNAARSTFVQLGAVVDLASLEELPPSPDPGTAPDGLTPRELEVLRLVASGRTDRQIADVLSISDKTVGRHIANIYRKIDVQTRSAATAYAFLKGLMEGHPPT